VELHGPGRPVEPGVAESEDPAVPADQPVAGAGGRGRDPDDRGAQAAPAHRTEEGGVPGGGHGAAGPGPPPAPARGGRGRPAGGPGAPAPRRYRGPGWTVTDVDCDAFTRTEPAVKSRRNTLLATVVMAPLASPRSQSYSGAHAVLSVP